jgi:hypothetical protein
MAEAKKRIEIVQRPVEEHVGFTLELSVEEAEALQAVLSKVSGSETKSPRGLIQNIYSALAFQGVHYDNKAYSLARGNVDFDYWGSSDEAK